MNENNNNDTILINKLKEFLLNNNIYLPPPSSSSSSSSLSSSSLNNQTIQEFLEEYYYLFTSNIIQLLIKTTLNERDENILKGKNENDLLGTWGIIIDIFKEITIKKREKSSEIMQKLCLLGQQYGQLGIDNYIKEIRKNKLIDSVLIDLVSTSYDDCRAMNGSEDILQMLKYIDNSLLPEKRYYEQLILQSKIQNNTNTTNNTTSSLNSKLSSIEPTSLLNEQKQSNNEEKDTNNFNQRDLSEAGELLQSLLQSCQGDAKKLKLTIIENIRSKSTTIVMSDPVFLKVLNDNISACHHAGYVNKEKLFQFMLQIIQTEIQNSNLPTTSNLNDENDEFDITGAKYGLNVYHAPQFVDERKNEAFENVEVSLVDETDGYVDAIKVSDALIYTATGNNSSKKVNKKKKNIKSDAKKKVHSLVDHLGSHLETYGWAVCDHTIPIDIIRRVRIEASLFTTFYEQSEIWVGKQADIGAHVVVPSVRGDKVLWMCGGHLHHTSPEGLTRSIKTHGEIEPCRLDVKAKAPIRRFAAMKELVNTIDKLIFEMKEKCPTLAGLYERSDAMLAIYPGEGARFAKHIDNTTQDGRRLTVLCYLNPDWEESMGGALRLFIPTKYQQKEGDSKITNSINQGLNTINSNNSEELISTNTEACCGYHMKAVDVYPQGGRLALFYSADIPHEVLPTFGQRHSITLWYYDTNERKEAIERAKESGKGISASKTSIEVQKQAQEFISKLMGGDDIPEDGGEPTQSDLTTLCQIVETLSNEVLELVSNITGAPSVESFRQGFPLLTVNDLKQMRALFRRMGLGSYTLK